MTRVGGYGAAVAGRLWRIAVLTAAGAIGNAAQAEAALYWPDSDSGYSRPRPAMPQPRQKPHRRQAKKIEAPERESGKPQGPLVIAISIDRQKLRIYDANGFFAETPISTGMKGHPTPMGVFSVIQKQKLHHSNIYSGAPMPYMQRITWSGIAIHAGVLPGYPASHGCIRMPMAFAMKMWNWTKMGARVVVTPGEMTPASFAHPLLVTQKLAPQPAAEPQADTPPAPKTDKATEADSPVKPAISAASLELRPTVGHADGARQSPSLRENTHTADASGNMPSAQSTATMTDAAPSGGDASPRDNSQTAAAPRSADEAAPAKAAEAAPPDAKPEAATSEPGAETKPAAAGSSARKPDEPAVAATSDAGAGKVDVSATVGTKAEETGEKKPEAKAGEASPEAARPDAPKSAGKSDDAAKTTTTATTTNVTPAASDAKKDQARLADPAKPAAAKVEPVASAAPKRTGQIAVFISRKDSKLYVRQNFAPLFDAPVTIAPSDRPLGTHVFTAELDKNDANVVHWSVVTLPVPRHAERRDEDERASRRRKTAGVAAEVKPLPEPDSPAEALDRLTIPADAMARITDALSTGASIIVSDQGISAGETGEGTDFIVSLR